MSVVTTLDKLLAGCDRAAQQAAYDAVQGLSKYVNNKLKQDLSVGYNFLILKKALTNTQWHHFIDYCSDDFGIQKKEVERVCDFAKPFLDSGAKLQTLLNNFSTEALNAFAHKSVSNDVAARLVVAHIKHPSTAGYLHSNLNSFSYKPATQKRIRNDKPQQPKVSPKDKALLKIKALKLIGLSEEDKIEVAAALRELLASLQCGT